MRYKFVDLNSLADYLQNEAQRHRDKIASELSRKSLTNARHLERAATLESVVHLLRNTDLGSPQ